MRLASRDHTRLPTKEEFDKLAGDFVERATLALLPSLFLSAIRDAAQSGLLPDHLRELFIHQRYSSTRSEGSASPKETVVAHFRKAQGTAGSPPKGKPGQRKPSRSRVE